MPRSLASLLPGSVKRLAKGLIGAFPSRLIPGKGAFEHTTGATRRRIRFELWRDPEALLQLRVVRQLVANDRASHFFSRNTLRKTEGGKEVARGTIEHNLDGARRAADYDRPMLMANVACAIEKVRRNIDRMDVLSIGPRSEIELFALRAVGFSWEHIKAMDLLAYSPYVQTGDVHAIPFPDNSFDVLFLGWVLAYSKDQGKAISEVIRVLRPGGIAVVASDYSSDETHTRNVVDSTHMQTSEQMLALFGDHVRYVYFRHDPQMPDIHMIMVAVEIKK